LETLQALGGKNTTGYLGNSSSAESSELNRNLVGPMMLGLA